MLFDTMESRKLFIFYSFILFIFYFIFCRCERLRFQVLCVGTHFTCFSDQNSNGYVAPKFLTNFYFYLTYYNSWVQ